MFRTKIFKNAKLNYKLYSQTVIVSNKPVKPYEVAESEEIDIRIVEEEKPKPKLKSKPKTNTNIQWGDTTIYME